MPSEWRERANACAQLLERTQRLHIPAPCVTECLRAAPAGEVVALRDLFGRSRTLVLNGPAGEHAARALRRCTETRSVCPSCLQFDGAMPCKTCGETRGTTSGVLDSLIAGCVLAEAGDWIFYTYDKRFPALFEGDSRIVVATPPPYQSTTPLLDYGERAASAASDEGKRA